jgi:hypothetical protein
LRSASGAKVTKGNLDVTDREGMAKFLLAVDKATPVECVRARLHAARTKALAARLPCRGARLRWRR